jgi:hypothetical protein
MGSQFDLVSKGRQRADFISGLHRFEENDYAAALTLFREADENASIDDVYQNRYTSYHGLVRVFMGDHQGVKLCRKAAVGETNDAEVYCNLAMAEIEMGAWESASHALRRGLGIAPDHTGLLQLEKEFTLMEQRGRFWKPQGHSWFDRLLGMLYRGFRPPHSGVE